MVSFYVSFSFRLSFNYFFVVLNLRYFFFLDINVDFHRLDEYSTSLLKKSQEESTKKDTFSSVGIYLAIIFVIGLFLSFVTIIILATIRS